MRLMILLVISCAMAWTAEGNGGGIAPGGPPLSGEQLLARWRLDHLAADERAQVLGLVRWVAAEAQRTVGGGSVAEAAQAYLAGQGYQPLRLCLRQVDGTQRLFVAGGAGLVATDAPLGLSLADGVYLCLPDRAGGIEQLIDTRGVLHRLIAAQWSPVASIPARFRTHNLSPPLHTKVCAARAAAL